MACDGVAPTRLLHNALLAAYAAAGDLEVGVGGSSLGCLLSTVP